MSEMLDEIKTLMKSGDVTGAEALCRKALETDPGNAQLKMLFGLCRQLQGDEETFRRIHDELAPEMERLESLGGVSSGGANPPGEPRRLGGDASPHQASPTSPVTAPLREGGCPEGAGGSPSSSPETLSLWRKYHKLWMALIIGALVFGLTAVEFAMYNPLRLYGGPQYYKGRMIDSNSSDLLLYGGPRFEDRGTRDAE